LLPAGRVNGSKSSFDAKGAAIVSIDRLDLMADLHQPAGPLVVELDPATLDQGMVTVATWARWAGLS
jgi:hypothetical protein